MADARDILNLPRAQAGANALTSPGKSTQKKKEKKPEGISREVFALIQCGAPASAAAEAIAAPVVPSIAFKEKRKIINKKKVTPWLWTKYKNSGRADGVELYRWQRSDDKPSDFVFARFNKALKIPEYTTEEYNSFLQDPGWSKEETDHLWDLCKRFDLRFVMIADRFEYPSRTVDDLKERFYSVAGKLIELHLPPAEAEKHPYVAFPFHKQNEVDRKRQADLMDNRSKEMIKEEEDLIAEMKRIEAQQKKQEKDRRKLSKLIASLSGAGLKRTVRPTAVSLPPPQLQFAVPQSPPVKLEGGAPSSVPASAAAMFQSFSFTPSTAAPPSPVFTAPAPPVSLPPPIVPVITPKPLPPSALAAAVRAPRRWNSGVSLRSTRTWAALPVPTRMARRAEIVLEELGVPSHPLPTASVTAAYTELRADIMALLEAQAQVDRKQYERQLLAAHVQGQDVSTVPVPATLTETLSPSNSDNESAPAASGAPPKRKRTSTDGVAGAAGGERKEKRGRKKKAIVEPQLP